MCSNFIQKHAIPGRDFKTIVGKLRDGDPG
jgi:hypothetical protein